jgi:D-alanyl-D-alanine carboxypeptidase
VVMGGNTTAGRDAHVEDLLDTGFVVEQRRAMGQKIDFAQNLAEPAPIGEITRPPTEEGAADQGGVHIVLTNNDRAPPPALAAPEARAVTPDKPTHSVRADRGARMVLAKADAGDNAADLIRERSRHGNNKADGEWAVQVGAYKGKSMAHAQVASISHKFSQHLGDARGGVEPAEHGYYRARFSGLSASDAKDACRALRAHNETCMVLPPTG